MGGRIGRAQQALSGLVAVGRTGVLTPVRPDRAVQLVRRARGWGVSPATGCIASAVRHPTGIAVLDDGGAVDWRTLDERTNAQARGLAAAGATPGEPIGVLCRNGRGFVEAVLAASKVGADVILLNTGFAPPQLAEVAAREGVGVVVHDEALGGLVAASGVAEGRRVLADTAAEGSLDALARRHDGAPLRPPPQPSTAVILTSGTTGTPKGARRRVHLSLGADGPLALAARVPIRARRTTLVAAPLFHAWGFAHLGICLAMSSPMVLAPRFDPERVLADIERHRVDTLVVVPVMLQRLLALPEDVRSRYDTSPLRLVASSGSALPSGLATRVMDAFGDVLYSLYGSTEVAWAAIAGPEHLRADPATAGPTVAEVRLLDADGRAVAPGETGRVFVRNPMLFEGYTGGGTKEVVDGFMSTGDVGHLDHRGWLHVDGREDDMIVSGGENVFPEEVEGVLVQHPDVEDAACVGVPDDEFGQRLVAFVVPRSGSSPAPGDLQSWVRDSLARYKIPRSVELVDELPRTTTGKVLRRVLTERAGGPPG
ncbi:MAG TPA: AMP-binding protein [Acidimicrobiales bacterium]|nr:AMP-binding protein [Acidimicrobiales bacterium]